MGDLIELSTSICISSLSWSPVIPLHLNPDSGKIWDNYLLEKHDDDDERFGLSFHHKLFILCMSMI